VTAVQPIEITAGALHLRPWRPDDANAVHLACQDPDIQRWTLVPVPYLRSDADHFVARTAPEAWASGTGAPFAVVDATTGALLASVGLVHLRDSGQAEIGYWCAAPARGRGVTTAAVGAVARWAFGALGVGRLEWRAEVGNWASRRVAEKAGFTLEGTLRRALPRRDGTLADGWVGSLLPDDMLTGARRPANVR
jgi:RimJ/RimL family protein N-acetyltransferase